MDVNDFIRKIEAELSDLKPGILTPETEFREKITWDSINALLVIAMVNVEYGVTLEATDLINSVTVNDVFEIVKKRANCGEAVKSSPSNN